MNLPDDLIEADKRFRHIPYLKILGVIIALGLVLAVVGL